jgi:glycosyltransferase involved in cell wall biosynthesis
MIGIAITTRNRYQVLAYTLAKFNEFKTDDMKIVVVDDASEDWQHNMDLVEGYGFTYISTPERRGIPYCKEMGFQRLKGCDYQFWFDDDCFPRVKGWEQPFIDAMELQGHLLYLKEWAHIKIKRDLGELIEYTAATGCFMTFSADMYGDIKDLGTQLYGGRWHPNLSDKMQKYGIGRYVSIKDAGKYLHSFDMDSEPKDFPYSFNSSVEQSARGKKK